MNHGLNGLNELFHRMQIKFTSCILFTFPLFMDD